MKYRHDHNTNVRPSNIELGDTVLVKNTSLKKTTPFNANPMQVVAKKGSMVTARSNNNKHITRNSSHFKKIPSIHRQVDGTHNHQDQDDFDVGAENWEDEMDVVPQEAPAAVPHEPPPRSSSSSPAASPCTTTSCQKGSSKISGLVHGYYGLFICAINVVFNSKFLILNLCVTCFLKI